MNLGGLFFLPVMPKNSVEDGANPFNFDQEDYDKDYSQHDLYDYGVDYLGLHGFYLSRSLEGRLVYHDVYMRRSPLPIKGVIYPPKFTVKMVISSLEEMSTLENVIAQMPREDARKFWWPLVSPDAKEAKPLYQHTLKLIEVDGDRAEYGVDDYYDLGISDEADGCPKAWIPKASWFDPKIRQVTLRDLFTLFPRVEQDMLALVLGRAIVGRSGHKPEGKDSILEHTSRMAAIIVGEDPGLGKSTLFTYFIAAIKRCGYRVSTFGNMSARFNMGDIACSHLCYKDDVVRKTLAQFLESERTKIMITNGVIRVESKGVDAIDVPSHTAFVVNTNEFDPRSVYNMDPGSADRFKLISTLRETELDSLTLGGVSEGSPSLKPYAHLEWLADKLDVSVGALMLWAARLCADRFKATIQEKRTDGVNPLERRVDLTTKCLRVKLHKHTTRQIMASLQFCGSLEMSPSADPGKLFTNFLGFDLGEALRVWHDLLTNPDHLDTLTTIVDDFEGESFHPAQGLALIDTYSLHGSLRQYLQDVDYESEVPVKVALKKLFSGLYTIDGFEIPGDAVWLNKNFQAAKTDLGNAWGLRQKVISQWRGYYALEGKELPENLGMSPHVDSGYHLQQAVQKKMQKLYDEEYGNE